ncbi:hypothetical protein PYCCODRAFT_272503 [Trametes coccinea BRFM310]|uniref:Velvet domain-containing protein n=1 Tax=Trametes coccinea (strain BRFM310) TaxID=1353009 RepID=A0A1Y2IP68_TRAC3|nr:hypothetical protein PYCCODRAFT_272503 [Trametes coccinea BRFM310]
MPTPGTAASSLPSLQMSPIARHDAYPRPHAVPREIGRPVRYDSGHLAQRTIRVEVEEIQKADLGRKYARKDKRPLDPPPVVLCRFYELIEGDNGNPPVEVDVDPDEMMLGVVCQVDLFPVPSEFERSPEKFVNPPAQTFVTALPPIRTGGQVALPSIHSAYTIPSPSSLLDVTTSSASTLLHLKHIAQSARALPPLFPTYPPHAPMASLQSTLPSAPPPFFAPPPFAYLPFAPQAPARQLADSDDPDIVGWFSDFPVRESSRCTVMLAGATFMEAAIIDYKGKRTAVFVFSDLAVKIEGTFVLRYRTFNILSERAIPPRSPSLAECYGGAFRVYSTKEFPGLKASTELTKVRIKLYIIPASRRWRLRDVSLTDGRSSSGVLLQHLALYGVRVNIREQPRKRRKMSEILASAGGAQAHRGQGHAHGSGRGGHGSGSPRSGDDSNDEEHMDDDEERKSVYYSSAVTYASWLPGSAASASASGAGSGSSMSNASAPGPPSSASPTSYYSPTMSVGSSFASVPPYTSPAAVGPSSAAAFGLGPPLSLGPALGGGSGTGSGLRRERTGRERLPGLLPPRDRGGHGDEHERGAGD